jgi:hypothetical protein
VITIRLDDDVHRHLKFRAAGANLSISAFVRPLIEDAAYPGGRYVYTSQDELLGVAIQTFAILGELGRALAPQALEQGLDNARTMLRERGLLSGDLDSFVGSEPMAAVRQELRR